MDPLVKAGGRQEQLNTGFALTARVDTRLLFQPFKMVTQCSPHEGTVLIGDVLLRPFADPHQQLPERLGAPILDGFRLTPGSGQRRAPRPFRSVLRLDGRHRQLRAG